MSVEKFMFEFECVWPSCDTVFEREVGESDLSNAGYDQVKCPNCKNGIPIKTGKKGIRTTRE